VLYSLFGWVAYSLLVAAIGTGERALLSKALLLIFGALLSGPMVWGNIIRHWFLRKEGT
jgi:hypothetical protein